MVFLCFSLRDNLPLVNRVASNGCCCCLTHSVVDASATAHSFPGRDRGSGTRGVRAPRLYLHARGM
jgi:hypothetical protein